jgi:hypothetical protein
MHANWNIHASELEVKFNQAEVDPTCPICKLETEDLQHPSTISGNPKKKLLQITPKNISSLNVF